MKIKTSNPLTKTKKYKNLFFYNVYKKIIYIYIYIHIHIYIYIYIYI